MLKTQTKQHQKMINNQQSHCVKMSISNSKMLITQSVKSIFQESLLVMCKNMFITKRVLIATNKDDLNLYTMSAKCLLILLIFINKEIYAQSIW
jgi:hypothetical protein